jgi:hypothetical protein
MVPRVLVWMCKWKKKKGGRWTWAWGRRLSSLSHTRCERYCYRLQSLQVPIRVSAQETRLRVEPTYVASGPGGN